MVSSGSAPRGAVAVLVTVILEILSLQIQGQSMYTNLTYEFIRLSPEPKKLHACPAPLNVESSEKAGLKVSLTLVELCICQPERKK